MVGPWVEIIMVISRQGLSVRGYFDLVSKIRSILDDFGLPNWKISQ